MKVKTAPSPQKSIATEVRAFVRDCYLSGLRYWEIIDEAKHLEDGPLKTTFLKQTSKEFYDLLCEIYEDCPLKKWRRL